MEMLMKMKMTPKPTQKLNITQVMNELAMHEAECNFRYKRIEERLDDQKDQLKGLDIRMWGLAVLIVGVAIAQRMF
jgi:hypothetical protein